jgi:hypothetical protein
MCEAYGQRLICEAVVQEGSCEKTIIARMAKAKRTGKFRKQQQKPNKTNAIGKFRKQAIETKQSKSYW